MVLSGAPSAFCRNSRFPLSSTTQRVTSTPRFLASASAAATMVLIAARSRYFLLGRSLGKVAKKLSITKNSLHMGRMLPIGLVIFQMNVACRGRTAPGPAPTQRYGLEREFQSKLYGAAAAGANHRVGGRNVWSGAGAAEPAGSGHRGVVVTPTVLSPKGIGKIRMIEQIEEFRAELHADALAKLKILHRRKIHVAEAEIAE